MPWPSQYLPEKLCGVTKSVPSLIPAPARLIPRADSFDPVVASACGVVLRSWRLDRGIAQDAFALSAGIDRSYYGKLERGERQPSLSVLLRCAAAFTQPTSTLVEAIERQLKHMRSAAEART